MPEVRIKRKLSKHSWDTDCEDEDELAISEDELNIGGDAPDIIDDSDEEDQSPSWFAKQLVEELILLYMGCHLSARTFCILMYLAWRAGLEACRPYALGPGKQTGKYQRFLDKVFNFKHTDGSLYKLSCPSTRARSVVREMYTMPVIPIHEALETTVDVDTHSSLQRAKNDNELPPSYFSNQLVKDVGKP